MCFSISVFMVYGFNLAILVKFRSRNKTYLALLTVIALAIKIIYYCWAVDGIILYFQYIASSNEVIKYEVFKYALAFLAIVNLLDGSRTLLLVLIVSVFHCYCRRRARRYRRGMEANP